MELNAMMKNTLFRRHKIIQNQFLNKEWEMFTRKKKLIERPCIYFQTISIFLTLSRQFVYAFKPFANLWMLRGLKRDLLNPCQHWRTVNVIKVRHVYKLFVFGIKINYVRFRKAISRPLYFNLIRLYTYHLW